ncbi:MAG TPA: MFS transporter [Candidatus Acidoferrum sp.]|nr:MFS transporter [Candidatus Acidoferrum sp.]
MALSNSNRSANPVYYGWWIVVAAFLNLFFVVGILFYGFPVFYPYFVESLGFTRAQVTQGFLLGFLFAGLPFGILAGTLIDRIGARTVILAGVGLVGLSLLLMGRMIHFWQFELLCVAEVIGYVMAGPIANQVLISRWFGRRRGRAMGYAYLGLGLGGVAAPMLVNFLARSLGWRHGLELMGTFIMLVLFPIGIWVTRSSPGEGEVDRAAFAEELRSQVNSSASIATSAGVPVAVRSFPFWLIVGGATLAIGAIGAVIQHFILFLKDSGYSATTASNYFTILLAASLGGRVIVGYLADRFRKSRLMALFYFVIGASVFLLAYPHSTVVLSAFAILFGFAMGADYMLIPLVTAECFGTAALGKLLALIIMGYSIGQWAAPWFVGKMFDAQHSYDLAWKIVAILGIAGAAAIYLTPTSARTPSDRVEVPSLFSQSSSWIDAGDSQRWKDGCEERYRRDR